MATLPIAWCLGWLSHGYPVSQVSHLMESSCAYVAHRKVPSCAYVPHVKVPSCAEVAQVNVQSCPYVTLRMVPPSSVLPISMCHHAPMLPTVCQGRLLHDAPMHPYWPTLVAIVCTSLLPILPIGCAHLVQSYQCAQNVPIVCQSFCIQGVPLLQKFPMSRCLCRPSCPCQCTPSVPKLPTAWCLCELSCTCL